MIDAGLGRQPPLGVWVDAYERGSCFLRAVCGHRGICATANVVTGRQINTNRKEQCVWQTQGPQEVASAVSGA